MTAGTFQVDLALTRRKEFVDNLSLTPKTANAEKILKAMPQILNCVPSEVAPRQFCIALMSEVNKLKPDVVPASVVLASLHCAFIGLVPGASLGQAYLIPYRLKGKPICNLVVGYRGYMELAFRANFLKDLHSDVVLDGESFKYWKDENGPRLIHENIPINRKLKKEAVLGAYCIYHTIDGGHGMHIVSREQIDAIDTESNVWRSDYVAMCRKTPIRRASKEWRQTTGLAAAVRLDEQLEAGEPQHLDEVKIGDIDADSIESVSVDLDTLPPTEEQE